MNPRTFQLIADIFLAVAGVAFVALVVTLGEYQSSRRASRLGRFEWRPCRIFEGSFECELPNGWHAHAWEDGAGRWYWVVYQPDGMDQTSLAAEGTQRNPSEAKAKAIEVYNALWQERGTHEETSA